MDNLLLPRQFRFRQPAAGPEPVRLLAPPAAAGEVPALSPRALPCLPPPPLTASRQRTKVGGLNLNGRSRAPSGASVENNPLWAELGKHWKLVALRGVAALVFGVLTLLAGPGADRAGAVLGRLRAGGRGVRP